MGKLWERWSCVLVWKEGWRGQRGGGGGGGGVKWIDAASSLSPWRLVLTICHPAGSLSFSLGPEWVRYTFTSSNSTFAYGNRWGTARYCKVNGENVKRIVQPQLKVVIIFRRYSETHYNFLCIELTSSLQQQHFHSFTYNKSGQRPVAFKLQKGQKATIQMYHLLFAIRYQYLHAAGNVANSYSVQKKGRSVSWMF